MKNLYPTKKIKRRYNGSFLLLFTVITAFVTTTIYFAIYGAIVSDKLVAIERKEDGLVQLNRSLSSDLVKLNSLTGFNEKTFIMGFEKPSNVVYLREEETVASLR